MRTAGAAFGRALPRNEALQRGLYSLDEDDQLRRFQQVFSIVSSSTMGSLFQPGLVSEAAQSEATHCWEEFRPALGRLDELNAFQLLELRSSLPDELLMYGDKLSMANALEVRVPYLDRELVEHVQQLGSSFKVRNGVRKWLHRRVCEKFLPPEVVHRKKRGFAVNVVDDWFKETLQGHIPDYLANNESLIYRYLRQDTVTELLRRHASRKADYHKILFSLVVLEQWLRSHSAAPATAA
jgi:asparagine synthase (glutamine-hydrolysing)